MTPSVVTIAASGSGGAGTGSGEVIRSDGYILTNNHVISIAAHGGTVEVLFADGQTAAAGLRPGDVVTSIAGKPATSNIQLQELTLTKKPGDTVSIGYVRDAQSATATVTLSAQP